MKIDKLIESMATYKNSKDVIFVNCQEVPETICVETRFINQSGKETMYFSNNARLEFDKTVQTTSTKTVQPVSKTPTFTVSIQPKLSQCQLPQQIEPVNAFVPLTNLNNNLSAVNNVLGPAVATQLSNTSQLSAFRLNTLLSFGEQIQQTDISSFNTKSIGIQCALDDELEDLDVEWPVMNKDICENNTDTENEMESFLKFIEDNSTQHKTYKECLICGELCKSNKYFYGHMAVHRGPKALCFKCGQYLEHENLLPEHNCQKAVELANAFLKCPHFSCDVKAISLLELYDHINEHTDSRIYKCYACRKAFCTGQEFLRHVLIRAKCYTSANKKRFRMYGLESQRDRQCRIRVFTLHTYAKCTTLVKTFLTQRTQKKGVCKICLKSFNNKSVYKNHRLVCIARFKKRLKEKR